MEGICEKQVGFYCFSRTIIGKLFGQSVTVGTAFHLPGLKYSIKIILSICVLDMGKQFCLMSDEIFTSSEKISGSTHFFRINVRDWKHAASEHRCYFF